VENELRRLHTTLKRLHSTIERTNAPLATAERTRQQRAQRPLPEQEADEVDTVLEKQSSDARLVIDALNDEAQATQSEINKLTSLDSQLAVEEEQKRSTFAIDLECLQARHMFKPDVKPYKELHRKPLGARA